MSGETSFRNNISEALDIDPLKIDEEPTPLTEVADAAPPTTDAIEDDFNKARQSIRGLLDTGNDALQQLMNIAAAGEHPRAFEVVATLISTLTNASKDLLNLQGQVQKLRVSAESTKNDPSGEIKPGSIGTQNINVNFIGTTAELQQSIGRKAPVPVASRAAPKVIEGTAVDVSNTVVSNTSV